MTDLSHMTSVTDVAVLHTIIVTFDKQVRRLEDDLSKATDKINRVVEENTRHPRRDSWCFCVPWTSTPPDQGLNRPHGAVLQFQAGAEGDWR